jgi:hypothetical protein
LPLALVYILSQFQTINSQSSISIYVISYIVLYWKCIKMKKKNLSCLPFLCQSQRGTHIGYPGHSINGVWSNSNGHCGWGRHRQSFGRKTANATYKGSSRAYSLNLSFLMKGTVEFIRPNGMIVKFGEVTGFLSTMRHRTLNDIQFWGIENAHKPG